MAGVRRHRLSIAWIAVISCARTASANETFIEAMGGAVKAMKDHPTIVMRSAKVRAKLSVNHAQVQCDYVFQNTGAKTSVLMGFPEQGFYVPVRQSRGLRNFRSFVDGKPVPTRIMGLQIGMTDNVETEWQRWRAKRVTFAAGQTRRVRNLFQSPLGLLGGKNGHHLFAYTVSTASSWKGPIDELEVVVELPRGLISVLSFEPEGWTRKVRTLRWHWKEREPTEEDDIRVWFFPGIDIDNDGDLEDAWLWGDHAPRFERGTITISAQLLADCLTTSGTMHRVDPATKKEIEDTRPRVPGEFKINPKSGRGSLSYGTKVISFRSGSSVANCEGQAIRLTRSVSRPIRRLEFTGPSRPKQWVYHVRVPVRIIEALGWRVHFNSENSTLHLIAPKEGEADKEKAQSSRLSRVAFQRDGCLWVMNADGSEQKRIAYGTSPSWSPSGRFLAFLHDGDICTLDMQTGRKRQLTRDGRWVSVPAWSPHEKWLAGGREIHSALGDGGFDLIAILDGRRTVLIPPKRGEGAVLCPYTFVTPQFSPDGRWIAFRDVGAKAYVIDTKQAGQRRVIPSEHSPLWVNGLAWLADPPRLLFSCTREDESTEGVGIWVYDPATGRSELWAMQGKDAYHLAVSPGVTMVATLQGDQKETNLWLISVADRKMRKVNTMPRQTSEVMDGIERICWSPDGRSLLVASGRAVSAVNLDGAGLSQLADRASHPDWWGPVQQAVLELEPASALKEFAGFVPRGFTLEHLVRKAISAS